MEHPTFDFFNITDELTDCYPYPSLGCGVKSAFAITIIEILIIALITIFSTFKFIGHFFYFVTTRGSTNKMAMVFWFLGVLFNAFLFVTVLMRQTLRSSSLSSVFTVLLSVLDIWPFTVIIHLILDIFGETGAFSILEKNMIKGMVRLFIIYTFLFPTSYCIIFRDFNAIQMDEFLIGSYVFLAIFVVFFCYIILRLFVCERYIAGLILGEKVLTKFQIGVGVLCVFLLVKIVVLYYYEVPPIECSVFWFSHNELGLVMVFALFYLLSNLMIYSVPYILISLGANYSKEKGSDQISQFASDKSVLKTRLYQDSDSSN